MHGKPGRWAWKGVFAVHRRSEGALSSCTGRIYQYTYRLYAPEDSRYERCVGMSWCSVCREASENLVFVSRDTTLADALADLPASERERIGQNSRKIRECLDRLVRRGLWP
ncbi:hypothetical protein AB0M36_20605 [Actinoplanes sp. NPDC051346]|uniref:hypothetical protein n=1 Tax=Actinoplanes sp. NPDC051346 TaxID=3155048 RepID=UPI003428F990